MTQPHLEHASEVCRGGTSTPSTFPAMDLQSALIIPLFHTLLLVYILPGLSSSKPFTSASDPMTLAISMTCFRALLLSLPEHFASTRLPLLDPFSFLWIDPRFSNEDMWTVVRVWCLSSPTRSAELLRGDVADAVSWRRFHDLKRAGAGLMVTACPICHANLDKDGSAVDASEVLAGAAGVSPLSSSSGH